MSQEVTSQISSEQHLALHQGEVQNTSPMPYVRPPVEQELSAIVPPTVPQPVEPQPTDGKNTNNCTQSNFFLKLSLYYIGPLINYVTQGGGASGFYLVLRCFKEILRTTISS